MSATDQTAYFQEGLAQGVLTHDPRLSATPWADHSSYTQQAPRPGIPEPDADNQGSLALSAPSETQDAGTAIVVEALTGGLPRTPPRNARLGWRDATADEDETYGWVPPGALTDWEIVHLAETITVYPTPRQLHCVSLTDGTMLIASAQTRSVGPTFFDVVVRRRARGETAWTSTTVHTFAQGTANADAWPCLVRISDDRLLLFHWVPDDLVEDRWNIRAHISTDRGETWTLYQRFCLATDDQVDTSGSAGSAAAGFDLGRIRGAYHDGQLLLVCTLRAHDTDDFLERLLQLYSDDQGSSLQVVDLLDGSGGLGSGTGDGGTADVVGDASGWYVAYIGYQGSETDRLGAVRILETPYTPLSSVAEITVDADPARDFGGAMPATAADGGGALALVRDEDGAFYLLGGNGSAAGIQGAIIYRSTDACRTWTKLGKTLAGGSEIDESLWFNPLPEGGSLTHSVQDLSACVHLGRIAVVHRWDNTGSLTNYLSIAVAYLGGWSTVTLPAFERRGDESGRMCWTDTWFGFADPALAQFGWTENQFGAATGVATEDGWEIDGDTGGSLDYTKQNDYAPTSASEGVIATAVVKRSGGAGTNTTECALRITIDDGTSVWRASVRVRNGTVTVRDDVAAADVGEFTGLTAGAFHRLLVSITHGYVRVWCVDAVLGEAPIHWGDPVEGELDDAASASIITADKYMIEWGALIPTTSVQTWAYALHTAAPYVGQNLEGFTNPADLFGRAFHPNPITVAHGVRVAASGGPVVTGDTFTVAARHDYPVQALHPRSYPSPRRTWRSLTDDTEQTIAWRLSEYGDAGLLSPILGCLLMGINFRTAYLEGRAGSSWSELMALEADVHGGTAVAFTREGNVIRPGAASNPGAAIRRFGRHELAGGTLVISTAAYRILGNSEGVWVGSSVSDTPGVRIYVDGDLSAEVTSGTCRILAPQVLGTIVTTDTFEGFRLRIPAQNTVDGYFVAAKCVLGPVQLFGFSPGWEQSDEVEHGTEVRELQDRAMLTNVASPARRRRELSWSGGVDLQNVRRAGGLPDFVRAATGGPAAAQRFGTPLILEELARELNGPDRTCVYLPAWPIASGVDEVWQSTSRGRFLYGRMTSPSIRREPFLGAEESSEVVRVSNLAFAEEP